MCLYQDPPQHVHWLHRSLRYAKRNLSLRCYRPPTLHGHVPPLTCTLCNYGRQLLRWSVECWPLRTQPSTADGTGGDDRSGHPCGAASGCDGCRQAAGASTAKSTGAPCAARRTRLAHFAIVSHVLPCTCARQRCGYQKRRRWRRRSRRCYGSVRRSLPGTAVVSNGGLALTFARHIADAVYIAARRRPVRAAEGRLMNVQYRSGIGSYGHAYSAAAVRVDGCRSCRLARSSSSCTHTTVGSVLYTLTPRAWGIVPGKNRTRPVRTKPIS